MVKGAYVSFLPASDVLPPLSEQVRLSVQKHLGQVFLLGSDWYSDRAAHGWVS
jgi:hypothetical protein